MRSAGIPVRGAYHFGHPGESASSQAAHFASVVGGVGAGEFLVLDIESATARLAANWSAVEEDAVATWCVDFVSAVMSKTGVRKEKMWVYTGAWFWNPHAGGSAALASHPLWVSGYASSPPMPGGWGSWMMWQYTDAGSWRGVGGKCDTSRYRGTQAELEALVA